MFAADKLTLNPQQILNEIVTLLETTAVPSDGNALLLNQEMQRRLEYVRTRILQLLKQVQARYSRNEEILVRRLKPRSLKSQRESLAADESISFTGAVLRGGTFFFKGNLYFRDMHGRSCPNNEDYDRRSSTEMFPTDFDMRSKHVWTVLDKKNIVMGIKEQLLSHVTYNKTGSRPGKRKNIDLHTQTLASLLSSVDSTFSIDWNEISISKLERRHSAYSCEAMWFVYLHPQLKRDDWTAEEDERLLEVAQSHKLQDWQAIASAVSQRSDYQCFVRVQTALRFYLEPLCSVKWSEQDNVRLRKIVERNTVNGVTDWPQVVEHFPGRSKSTLIGRYLYVLHPSICHEPFTDKEDLMLFAAVEEYNGKFHCFPRTLFPNRSLAQLRTRYHNVLAQRNKTDSWSVEDDNKLMGFVKSHGTSQWVNCASHLGNHTRTSCRTRFMVIKRFLEQHPDAEVSDIPRRKTTKNAAVTSENWVQRFQEWQEDPDSLLDHSDVRPKAKKIKREQLANVNKRRGIDVHIYEYFKFAYHLSLQSPAPQIPLPREKGKLNVVAKALRFRPVTTSSDKLVESIALPKYLCRCYSEMLSQLPPATNDGVSQAAALLQPNWSTMMGFRSICILSAHCRKHATQSSIDYDESHAAVQLFRQRLRTLFFRTTLLSRLEPSMFEQLPVALMRLPRPVVNYPLRDTRTRVDAPLQSRSKLTPTQEQETARRQIKELEPMSKSEPIDCKEEPIFKEELSID
ncbi:uncharacterized protein LOC117574583 [Drosophila albomicans]|uniref:Uncharacterized protein LOC117574583 n=1 Tax=Drosophila albomicans TaxID=7291 RepID=A0A9C6T2E6_DROAB|nr:uncharacterized protein LOC117574583 [Drosophila albomicans]